MPLRESAVKELQPQFQLWSWCWATESFSMTLQHASHHAAAAAAACLPPLAAAAGAAVGCYCCCCCYYYLLLRGSKGRRAAGVAGIRGLATALGRCFMILVAAAQGAVVLALRVVSGMGAFHSSSTSDHPQTHAATAALANHGPASPTKVEMDDGRVMSYDSYVQHSIGRFMPAKSTRKTKARSHALCKSPLFAHAAFQADAAAATSAASAPQGIAKAPLPAAASRSKSSGARAKLSPAPPSPAPPTDRPQPVARASAAKAAASQPPPKAAASKAPPPADHALLPQPVAVFALIPRIFTTFPL
jgi:hypothetical protein